MLALLCASGCRSEPERAREASLEHIGQLVDRLRYAQNREKAPHLESLRAAACGDTDACGLQALCVQAYSAHARALAAIDDLARLAEVDAGTPGAVRRRFAEADRELTLARALTDDCSTRQAQLRAALR